MPIPSVTEFEGLLPAENDPATFPSRAEALFDWLVGAGMPELNAAIAAINIALNDNGTVLDTAGRAIAITRNANTTVPTAGTGNAYTITPAVGIAAYQEGDTFLIRADRANSGPVTLKVDVLAAIPVRKPSTTGSGFVELAPGDWQLNDVHVVSYRDGQFELLSIPLQAFVRNDVQQTVTAEWTFTATATFATYVAAFARVSHPTQASLDLQATGVADTHERVRLYKNTNGYGLQTLNAAATAGPVDYAVTVGANGATAHEWFVWLSSFAVTAPPLQVTGNGSGEVRTRTLLPQANGAYPIGAVGNAFSVVHAVSGVVTGSDARLKEEIADLTEAERRAAAKIRTRTYRLKATGEKQVGYVAQEVIEALASEGLDAFEYGLVIDGETYGINRDAINAFRLG